MAAGKVDGVRSYTGGRAGPVWRWLIDGFAAATGMTPPPKERNEPGMAEDEIDAFEDATWEAKRMSPAEANRLMRAGHAGSAYGRALIAAVAERFRLDKPTADAAQRALENAIALDGPTAAPSRNAAQIVELPPLGR